jgi:uncharacterized protein YhfF
VTFVDAPVVLGQRHTLQVDVAVAKIAASPNGKRRMGLRLTSNVGVTSRMEPLPTVDAVLAELAARGVALPAGRVRVDGYGDSALLSQELLELIRSGRKRAGTSLLWAAEAQGEALPTIGDIEIVVDHRNRPSIVTRIVQVQVAPFCDVTAEYAANEGEGDGSLDYWRRAHWSFFGRECKRISREPSQSMPVICSVFEVLHVLPSATGT